MIPIDINFKATTKQFYALELLRDHKHREIGYGGGAGGGKSYLGCFWLLMNALAYPGTAYLMGRKELINLKRTTLMSFFKICRESKFPMDQYFKLDHQRNIIRFNNGSNIFLMDLGYQPSDPLYQRLGSLELTQAFVDESAEILPSGINILGTRLGRCNNDKYNLLPKLLETFNPSKNHVYYRYYKPYKDKELPEHRIFIPALVTDNPYIDKEYITQLKNSDEVTRQRLLFGNFEYDDDPAALFEFKKIIKMFREITEKTHQKYMTVDVARLGKDRTVIMIWDGLHIIAVYYYPKTKTNETEDYVKEKSAKYNIPMERIVIDEDGVGGGVVDHLPGTIGFVNNSSAFPELGRKSNHKNLKSQCYYKLADYVNEGKISMTSTDELVKDCIIQELEQVKRKNPDKDGKIELIGKEEIKEQIGRSPDFADAMMMRMIFEVRSYDYVLLGDNEAFF